MARRNAPTLALALTLVGLCLLILAGVAVPMAIHRTLENQDGTKPPQPLLSIP